ncbi:MAG: polysaccharide ABC transporter ATP-binding protein [Nitrospinales bacterium]
MSNKDIAIKVENLSKLYRIGLKEEMHESIAATMFDFIKKPLKNYRKYRSLYKFDDMDHDQKKVSQNNNNTIWALKDISFEVRQGEALAIIGSNGAGKSTLLKILSRITDPYSGRAELHGRVSSLLEVGTGFHQELSGRENVYLNGTIYGMKKKEVDRKFDEIVAFSGVEKFIDTPVKRYSSGMKVRLAFSVAAHLDPEILIVDEVLAVGDAAFQKKCLNKMQMIEEQGRTILFVSHNMPAVTRLCERAILLEQGKLLEDGPSSQIVANYLNDTSGTGSIREWPDPAKAPGGKVARVRAVRVRKIDGRILQAADTVDITQPFIVEMEYDVIKSGHVLLPNFHFFNEQGIESFSTNDLDPEWRQRPRPTGTYVSSVFIPGNFLAEGRLNVKVALITLDPIIPQFGIWEAVAFSVVEDKNSDTARGDYHGKMGGVVRPLLEWKTQFDPSGSIPFEEN